MQALSRRRFLSRSTTAMAAGRYLAPGFWKLAADPLGLPVGFQSYSVRQSFGDDFGVILKRLADVGYRMVELCSPVGYEKSGYASLLKMSPAEIRDRIRSVGLGCVSSHFGMEELRDRLDDRIAFAKEVGLQQMILAHPGLRPTSTLDDWRRKADDLNKIGERTRQAGIQFGYHNHDVEFTKMGDVLIYDEFMRRLEPNLVKMQFQTAVVRLGFEPATYLAKYPGRILSLHVSDWSAEKRMVAVGQGVIDWKKLFAAAKTGGIRNYFVEMPLDLIEKSYPYLHALKA